MEELDRKLSIISTVLLVVLWIVYISILADNIYLGLIFTLIEIPLVMYFYVLAKEIFDIKGDNSRYITAIALFSLIFISLVSGFRIYSKNKNNQPKHEEFGIF